MAQRLAGKSKRKSLPQDDGPSVDRWKTALLAVLVALVVASTFVPEDPGGRRGHGAPLDLVWLMLAGAWLYHQLRRGKLQFRFGWPDLLVVAVVAWYAVSALVAMWVGSPRPAMNVMWDSLAMGLLFLLARQILDAEQDIRSVIVVMVGLAVGMAAVAVHQYFVTMPVDVAAYEAAKHSTKELYEQTGQWLPPGSVARVRFEARLNSRLPAATFALSNSLAGFLVAWLMMLVGLTLEVRRRTVVLASLVLSALMVGCLWLTGSRTAGVAAVVGLSLLAIEYARAIKLPRKWWAAAMAGIVVLTIAAAALAFGTELGTKTLDAAWRSVAFRVDYWRATLAMIKDYPLFGCGPGQFQDTYTGYNLVGAAEEIQDPHNWLLEVWANAGTPAAICLVAMIGTVAWRALRPSITPSAPSGAAASCSAPDAALFGGVAGVVLGTALAWLTGYSIPRTHLLLFVAAIVGAWFLFGDWVREGSLPRRLPLVAVIALLVNLFAAGGIGCPSVAESLWLLLAISLCVASDGTQDMRRVPATKSIRWATGLALTALLVSAIWFEYVPVMSSRTQLDMADAAAAEGRSGPSRAALEAALAADSWSADAATRLAAQRFADYQSQPTPAQLRSLVEADALARQLAPRRSSTWAQSGNFAAAIYRDTRNVEYLKAAEGYYARALVLYPTSADLQAEVAKFWQSAGERARARDGAAEALRLDDAARAAGHQDRAFDRALRQEIEAMAAGER